MDRIPESAAVNEAVKQAGKLRKKNLRGVVNGILRNICRKKNEIVFPDADRDPQLYLAIAYAYPLWLVKKWTKEQGMPEAEKMLRAGNEIPGLFIRTNTLITTREKLLEALQEEEIACLSDPTVPESVEITRLKGPLHRLQSFREGLFQVQSRPAQICSHLLFPEPGEAVLDVCAGFGGKSTHMAALMKDRGFIVGMDTNRERLQGLVSSAERLKIALHPPVMADATRSLPRLLKGRFHKVLVDAPCSGLGVISRHPDIKLVKTGKDIERLADLQQILLHGAVPILKPEGKLLYVTCTVSKEENEDNVERFLRKNSTMALVNLRKCTRMGIGPGGWEWFFSNPAARSRDGRIFRRPLQEEIKMDKIFSFFCTTPLFLEQLLADELASFGATSVKETKGGVSFEGNLETAYRVCLWSRIANRLFLEISTFDAGNRDALYGAVQEIPWETHLTADGCFKVRASLYQSGFNNSQFAALVVKDSVSDYFTSRYGKRPSVEILRPDVIINLHLQQDKATLSLDLSGESLHRRNYKRKAGRHPEGECCRRNSVERGMEGDRGARGSICRPHVRHRYAPPGGGVYGGRYRSRSFQRLFRIYGLGATHARSVGDSSGRSPKEKGRGKEQHSFHSRV